VRFLPLACIRSTVNGNTLTSLTSLLISRHICIWLLLDNIHKIRNKRAFSDGFAYPDILETLET